MARSFSSAKIVSAIVSNAITRRGYSAAASASGSQGVVVRGGAAAASRNVSTEQASKLPAEKVAWVPDPVTGYYRPEGVAEEIDVAELRAMLLKKN